MSGNSKEGKAEPADRPTRLRRWGFWLLSLVIITWVMSVISGQIDKLREPEIFKYLNEQQELALTATKGFSPLEFFDRYLCAVLDSPEDQARQLARYGFHRTVDPAKDCMYDGVPVKPGAPLPGPVVGHWASNLSPFAKYPAALLDVGWHLLVQPSVLASIVAVTAFAIGAILALALIAQLGNVGMSPAGGMLFAIATILFAIAAAYLFQQIMLASLVVFGRLTSFGALCCTASGVLLTAYNFALKLFETLAHRGVEHILEG